jgi:hypothetical protein
MNTPIVTEIRRNGNPVGERVELARYTVPDAGTRILYGQRVDGVVRFLPEERVVLVRARACNEDGTCRSRSWSAAGGRAHALRQKRQNDQRCASGGSTGDGREVHS